MLTKRDEFQKRFFDIVFSIFCILLTWWVVLLSWIIATVETKSNGIFRQKRIGKDGQEFYVYKIKTMHEIKGIETTVTTKKDRRITKSGICFRSLKIDELPQLFNVLWGSMSFVGPRPDVSGFADLLRGEDRIILSVLPGITGPASLFYKDEESVLAKQKDPEEYNKNIIWPDKVKINKKYIKEWSLKKDILYIIQTITG